MMEEQMYSSDEDGAREAIASPGRNGRIQEKEQLQDLNGRLAVFMDRIQFVREQSDDLRGELERSKDIHKREMEAHRSLFERELSEARKLLDETAREKAKFELASSRNSALAADLKQKLEEESQSRSKAEKLLQASEREVQQCHHHIDDYVKEQKKLEERIAQMDADVKAYQEQAEEDRTKLEAEMVTRVNAQNNCQSLHEEIAFGISVHMQEKDDLRSRLATLEREHSELKHCFEKELEIRVAQTLAVASDEQEQESDRIREELDQIYSAKLREATDRHERDASTLTTLSDVQRDLSQQNDELHDDNATLTAKVAQLSKQLDNREYERLRDREHYRGENEHLQKELEVLQQELSSKLTEFADLMDVNIRLDKEISRYHRLLREQERKVGLDGGDLSVPGTTPRSKSRPAKIYASPLSRPLPPPLSTLPRLLAGGGLPPPLPPRQLSAAEVDGLLPSASAASSFISFLTGIGRKRSHPTQSATASSAPAEEVSADGYTLDAAAASDSPAQEDAVCLNQCQDGHFVKLINNTEEDVPLAGWRLERPTEKKALVYRFNKTGVLKASGGIHVWSQDSGHSSNQSTDYVSRHVPNWSADSQYPISLYDSENVVQGKTAESLVVSSDPSDSGSPSKKKRNSRPETPVTASDADAAGDADASDADALGGDALGGDKDAEPTALEPIVYPTSLAEHPEQTRQADEQPADVEAASSVPGSSKLATSKPSSQLKGRSLRYRARSKSPSRRLAKSLSTVAVDKMVIASASSASATSSVLQTGERSFLQATGEELSEAEDSQQLRRGASTAANNAMSSSSIRRKRSASKSGEATDVGSDVHDLAGAVPAANQEEIFHEQGDPAREPCVIW